LNFQMRSYASAFRPRRLTCTPEQELRKNYRAENSHQAVRRRECRMQRIRSGRSPALAGSKFVEKCIGAAVRRWSSTGSGFLDSGNKAGDSGAGRRPMRLRQIRRIFFVELFRLLRVVWPILSGVLFAMVGPGLVIGRIEGWRIDDALYFTFVTGLTIGYGDLTPRHVVSRLLAVMIGFAGIVLTGLVAAVSVEALRATTRDAGE
jgi:hypothetical protein